MNNDIENTIWDILTDGSMDTTDVVRAFVNYYGTKLLSEEFLEFLQDEGYCL